MVGCEAVEQTEDSAGRAYVRGTRGKGLSLVYPSWSIPTHPLSSFGVAALGKNLGELGMAR